LSKNAVSRLEEGTISPRLPTVEKLARALGVDPAWLAYGLGEQVAQTWAGPLR
jgi:transcriptional regulator with XRE-family HTH domain